MPEQGKSVTPKVTCKTSTIQRLLSFCVTMLLLCHSITERCTHGQNYLYLLEICPSSAPLPFRDAVSNKIVKKSVLGY